MSGVLVRSALIAALAGFLFGFDTLVIPVLVGAVPPGYVFLLFMGMMVLQLLWVLLRMPETRGVPLEQLQATVRGA